MKGGVLLNPIIPRGLFCAVMACSAEKLAAKGLRRVTILSGAEKNGIVTEAQHLLLELKNMAELHKIVAKRPRFTNPRTRTRRVVRIQARRRSYRTHRKASASTSADDGGGGSGQGDPDSSEPPPTQFCSVNPTKRSNYNSLIVPWPRHGCCLMERGRTA
jgi:hypothetical protein